MLKEENTLTTTIDRWYNSAVKPEELKKWREKAGYTQAELAGILGVAMFSVCRWEIGTRAIPAFLHLALKAIPKKHKKKTKVSSK